MPHDALPIELNITGDLNSAATSCMISIDQTSRRFKDRSSVRTLACIVGVITRSIGQASRAVRLTQSKTLTGTLDFNRNRDRVLKERLVLRRCCGRPAIKVWRIEDRRSLYQNSAKFACTSTYLQPCTHLFWPDWKTNPQMLGGAQHNNP